MGRKLRFGGPNLPAGRSTWYLTHKPDGKGRRQVRAEPGHEVDAEQVHRDGTKGLIPNADYYVNAGLASWVEAPKPKVRKPIKPATPAEEKDNGD